MNKYLNQFIRGKCGPDLLALKIFPNVKEITESFGCYYAVRDYMTSYLGDRDIVIISIGDGRTPRTASTFAFKSGLQCISVDPMLKNIHKYKQVDRLTCLDCNGEDIPESFFINKRVIVVGVHSHGPFNKIVSRIRDNSKLLGVVAIPCCFDMGLWKEPDFEYFDKNIISEKKKVMVWLF